MDSNDVIAEVCGLKAAYGESTILEDINLTVHRREILTVIGGSGSGKTTLLKHFIGLKKPAAGIVQLFGRDWWEMGEKERDAAQRKIGVLFQQGALFGSKTIGTNISIPIEQHTHLPDRVIQRVVQLKLKQVGLEQAIDLLPSELSGGMRKRAALARALALDPPMIFCDEPSAGLDPETSYQLDRLLLNLRANLGLTIIVVTHELASIRRIADRIAFLEGGSKVFDGTLAEALASSIPSVSEFFTYGGMNPSGGDSKSLPGLRDNMEAGH